LKTDSHKDRDLHDCQFISDSLWLTIDEIITIYAAQDEELARTLRQRKIDLFGDETNKSAFKKFFNYLEKLVGRDVKYLGEKSGYDSRKIWTENGLINDKQGFWHNNGRFRTIDLYHREQFPTMKITDRILQKQMDFTDVVKHKDGDPVSESDTWYNNDKLQHVLSNLPDPDAIVREGFTNKIVQSSVCPGLQLVLYDGLAQLQNKEADFKFTKLDCYDFHPDMLETRSVVDNIKDSVKSFNKRNNTLLEYLLRATHLEYLISDKYKNKVPDMTANKVGQVRFLPDSMMQDGDHAFRRIEPPQRDLAIEKFMESDFNLIDKLSGVNDNSKGIPQGENSGRLFIARAEASESMQSWITENGQSALTEIARKDIFYFQTFLTERRVIRLLDDSQKPNWLVINDQDPYGNVLNDITIGEFDVIISKVAVGKIAKAMEDQRDLQIIDLSGNIPGMETVSKILIRDVISRNNLSTKNEIIPIINQLIQLDMMKIQQVLNPTPQPDPNQVQPPTDPELAQLAKLKAATDIHKGMLANQGQQLDNAEKKVNIASLLSDHAANHLKNMNMIHKLITPQPVQQQ